MIAVQPPNLTRCFMRIRFDNPQRARVEARALNRNASFRSRVESCKECGGFHIIPSHPLDKTDVEILHKIAQGLQSREIAQDLGVTKKFVDRRVDALVYRFDCLNRSNLVATAMALGVIDVTSFIQGARNGSGSNSA